MPVSDYTFKSAAKTDVGLVRDLNEDACLLLDQYGLFAVADGMGGYDAGEVASQLALDTLRRAIENQYRPLSDDLGDLDDPHGLASGAPVDDPLVIDEPEHSEPVVEDSGITEAMSADFVEVESLVKKRDHGITEVEFIEIEDNPPELSPADATDEDGEPVDTSAEFTIESAALSASGSSVNFILVSPIVPAEDDFPMLDSVVDGDDIPMLDEAFDDDGIPVMDEMLDEDAYESDDAYAGYRPDGSDEAACLDWLQQSVHDINQAVFKAAAGDQKLAGMGTTIVIARFGAQFIDVAHVGDSRAYRYRDGELIRLTKDHSLVQEQLDAGYLDEDSARHVAHRNIVTRAIGPYPAVKAEVNRFDVLPNDKIMLCSDGITEELTDDDILRCLSSELSPNKICDRLIQAALDNGGHDNMTVAVVIVEAEQNGQDDDHTVSTDTDADGAGAAA